MNWVLLVLALSLPISAAAAISPGDDRTGYDQRTYQTASRAIEAETSSALDLAERMRKPPLGLPKLETRIPTSAQIDLGRRLFFDRRLSFNGTLSCGMCHIPEQGFTQQEQRTPVGFEGKSVRRNAPSLYNVAYRTSLFHDGRETSLELQILSPLLAANEMANVSIGHLLARLASIRDYAGAFEAAFDRPLGVETLGAALAAYQRGLVSGNSPFDRWHFASDGDALTASAQRGFVVFQRVGCINCHTVNTDHALFSDGLFHDTGIGYSATMLRAETVTHLQLAPGTFVQLAQTQHVPLQSDLGRYEVTRDPADRWKYTTPSLRNIALTAPYMHDGSLPTLDAVLDHYAQGGVPHEGLDPLIRVTPMTPEDRADLIAFLNSLTGDDVAALASDARSIAIGD